MHTQIDWEHFRLEIANFLRDVDIVKVIDIQKGELLAQHHFGLAENIETQLKVGVMLELRN